jgi:hypothetical protein
MEATATPSINAALASQPPSYATQKTVLPGQTPDGQYILGVLVKRTYAITGGKRCVRMEADQKLLAGDVFYGDPMNSAVKVESDFVPFKIATDVALNGNAYAPQGKPVPALTASLQIGEVRKDVRVIGDRVCRYRETEEPLFTDPQPFTKMELRYDRAYGGVDIYSDPKVACGYARNHLGKGFVVGKSKKAIENLPLPNLEDPADFLTPARLSAGHFMYWERQPMPACFGWFLKYWQPRALLAGVMPADRAVEQELRKAYATVIPPDQREMYAKTNLPGMDFRFFNGASPGLVLPYLNGDETVRTSNLTPEGEFSFSLPGERPRIALDIGSGMNDSPVVLHTVMIRMEERQVDLVWRAAFPYAGPDWLPQMMRMEVIIE